MKFLIIAIIILGAAIGYFSLSEPKKPECQNGFHCFEKLSENRGDIKKIIKLLDRGDVNYQCKIIKSQYMKSEITDYISEGKFLELTESIFGKSGTQNPKNLTVKCKLYENDIEDPKKKSNSCKLFAGYLLYEFIIQEQTVYKIQIDYTNIKGKDIQRKLNCIKESLYRYI